jgi:hypothetical protein
LTNVKLRCTITFQAFNSDVLTSFLILISDQTAKVLHFVSAIPKLTGQNYVTWREELEVVLTLAEIDLALTEPRPTEPAEPVRVENETDDAFANRKQSMNLTSTSGTSQIASARLSSRIPSQRN